MTCLTDTVLGLIFPQTNDAVFPSQVRSKQAVSLHLSAFLHFLVEDPQSGVAVGLAHCPEGRTVSPAHCDAGTSGYWDVRSPVTYP